MVHVANFRDDEDVDRIYNHDDNLAAFSSNFASTAAWTLFEVSGSTPAAQDDIFVGANVPWKHIAFEIGTAGNVSATISLYYFNGATWPALILGTDYTIFAENGGEVTSEDDLFQQAGKWAINIFPPSDWATTAINGDTRYWVSINLDTVSSWTTSPTHVTAEPYSQRSPHVAIPSASIKGDSPPLFNIRMWSPSGGTGNPTSATVSRVLIGAKSRNLSTFVSHLNAGGDDNPANWAVTDSLDGTSAANVAAPGGKHLAVDFSSDTSMIMRAQFAGTDLMDDWTGEYLVLVRCQQIGTSAGDIKLKVVTYLGGTSAYDSHADTREEKTRGNDEGPEVLDFGRRPGEYRHYFPDSRRKILRNGHVTNL
jgi:hypothetical protein